MLPTFCRAVRRWSFGPLLGLGLLQASPARGQAVCDGVSMATLLTKAQSLAADTEASGLGLLKCPRDEYRDAALYWLGFYWHMTQQDKRFSEALKNVLPVPPNEKNTLRQRAWAGEPQSLKLKIQSGSVGFSDDASLLLTLARSSVRAGQYKDGFQSYEIFLKQVDNQDAVEAERLFAYIWAGDNQAARLQIAALKRYELTPYLRQALERAELLLGPDQTQLTELIGIQGPWLRLSTEQYHDNKGYDRRSLRADYSGFIDVGIHAFETRHPLDPERRNQAALSLGRIFETGSWRWRAEGGFFSGGSKHLMGLLQSEWFPIPAWSLGVGLQRQAIALVEKPLLGEREGLMRDTAELLINMKKRLIIAAALHQDDGVARFETYRLELRLGSPLAREWDEGFGFFLPLFYQHRPTPSPDFIVYPKEFRAGLGLRLAFSDGASYRIGAEALIESISRSYYESPESFDQLVGSTVKLDARYYATRALYFFAEGAAQINEKNDNERFDERKSSVSLGVALRDLDKT